MIIPYNTFTNGDDSNDGNEMCRGINVLFEYVGDEEQYLDDF